MLNEWDRDKLRQALGPETGDKVSELLGTTGDDAGVAELSQRLESIEADNAALKTANENLAAEVAELKARPVASPTPPVSDPTDGE